jgi:hypothetical protein
MTAGAVTFVVRRVVFVVDLAAVDALAVVAVLALADATAVVVVDESEAPVVAWPAAVVDVDSPAAVEVVVSLAFLLPELVPHAAATRPSATVTIAMERRFRDFT